MFFNEWIFEFVQSTLCKINFRLILFLFLLFSRYLICFLGKLASRSEVTKMSASNIAIVIAPNIIWSEQEKE